MTSELDTLRKQLVMAVSERELHKKMRILAEEQSVKQIRHIRDLEIRLEQRKNFGVMNEPITESHNEVGEKEVNQEGPILSPLEDDPKPVDAIESVGQDDIA